MLVGELGNHSGMGVNIEVLVTTGYGYILRSVSGDWTRTSELDEARYLRITEVRLAAHLSDRNVGVSGTHAGFTTRVSLVAQIGLSDRNVVVRSKMVLIPETDSGSHVLDKSWHMSSVVRVEDCHKHQ
jgi:hypothetical protein